MKILSRKVSLAQLPGRVWNFFITVVRTIYLFKHSISLLAHYLNLTTPSTKLVELHNGIKIYISDNKYDVATLFVVFSRADYGKINKGDIVIDIGANLGSFSLYAATSGSSKVYAFEPNLESYNLLLRNIEANRLNNIIHASRLAVTGKDDQWVNIACGSSPFNKLIPNGHNERKSELVRTISLESIIEKYSLNRVDFLKIDCEGSEYDILYNAGHSALSKIQNIRMEYHYGGSIEELSSHLVKYGFHTIRHCPDNPHVGYIWFGKFPNNYQDRVLRKFEPDKHE